RPCCCADVTDMCWKTYTTLMSCIGTMNLLGKSKRRSGGALQNLAEVRATVANAPASWSAAVLRRFRWERALEIRAVHEKSAAYPKGINLKKSDEIAKDANVAK